MSALIAFAAGLQAWGQSESGQQEVVSKMIQIVLENNPTLASQEKLVRESEKLPEVRGIFALTGVNISAGTSIWDPYTGSWRFLPSVTLGTSFTVADPVRLLNGYSLKKEQESAKQEYQRIRDSLVSDLLSAVREILGLQSKGENLGKLKVYLEDYSDLIEKQVKAGAAAPDPAELWNLKERIIDLEVQIQDVKNKLSTTKLETAMRLGGSKSEELLGLLARLGQQSQ